MSHLKINARQVEMLIEISRLKTTTFSSFERLLLTDRIMAFKLYGNKTVMTKAQGDRLNEIYLKYIVDFK